MVPLLERCEMDATLHLAKSQHPKLPPLRLGLTLPTLRFYISPARLHRVMRILHAALPSALCCVPVEKEDNLLWMMALRRQTMTMCHMLVHQAGNDG